MSKQFTSGRSAALSILLIAALVLGLGACGSDSSASGSSSSSGGSSTTAGGSSGSGSGTLSSADRTQAIKALKTSGAPFSDTEAGCIIDNAYTRVSQKGRDLILSGDSSTDDLSAADQAVVTNAIGKCVSMQTLLKSALSSLTPAQASCITTALQDDHITVADIVSKDANAEAELSAAATKCALPAGAGDSSTTTG